MQLETIVRAIVLLFIAAVIVTWLDNRNIASRTQQHFAHREPAEQTIFVLCPVITREATEVSDAVSSICQIVKDARWPEALTIAIVHLCDKHLKPNQELDVRVAARCRVLGIPNVHVRCKRFNLPSDKQLRRNRALHAFGTLEYARKIGIQQLYNREDFLLIINPATVTTEPWWDSVAMDTYRQAISEGHRRPIVTCVPQFQGIYAFDKSPEYVARITRGTDKLVTVQTTPWVCPWFAFMHSRFLEEQLPFDTAQPDDMQVTALIWSNFLSKRYWSVVLPITCVASGHLVRNEPFQKERLEHVRHHEQCCVRCGHPLVTHSRDHAFQSPL